MVLTADIDRVASTPDNQSVATRPSAFRAGARKATRPLRAIAVFGAIGALVAGIALPTFAPSAPVANATATIHQIAADDAQSLVIASEVSAAPLERGTYSATSQEEIDKKKAEEAAARAAKAAAASRAGVAGSIDLSMVGPGSGAVRWPLSSFTYGPRNHFRSSVRPNHNGFDMLAPARTPIFAVADGVVRLSSESHFGYGVAVIIDHVINGQRVSTLYGHMTSGSRAVSSGQRVSAGQVIGLVGTTGRSSANHLHIEVRINGGLVDPHAWLRANAG